MSGSGEGSCSIKRSPAILAPEKFAVDRQAKEPQATLLDAPEFQPTPEAVSNLQGFSPCQRPFPTLAPCPSTSPACRCSCANSRRFELLPVELQSCLPAGPAIGTIGPDTPWRRSILPATRASAGSAHSAH